MRGLAAKSARDRRSARSRNRPTRTRWIHSPTARTGRRCNGC